MDPPKQTSLLNNKNILSLHYPIPIRNFSSNRIQNASGKRRPTKRAQYKNHRAILAFDLLTFLLDLVMVLRRWKFVIALRYIMCSVSLSLSVVLSVNFYLFSE